MDLENQLKPKDAVRSKIREPSRIPKLLRRSCGKNIQENPSPKSDVPSPQIKPLEHQVTNNVKKHALPRSQSFSFLQKNKENLKVLQAKMMKSQSGKHENQPHKGKGEIPSASNFENAALQSTEDFVTGKLFSKLNFGHQGIKFVASPKSTFPTVKGNLRRRSKSASEIRSAFPWLRQSSKKQAEVGKKSAMPDLKPTIHRTDSQKKEVAPPPNFKKNKEVGHMGLTFKFKVEKHAELKKQARP